MQVLSRCSTTILLIDHDPSSLAHLVQTLTAAGHRCLASVDPGSALAQVRQQKPDLMISEFNLAGHNGVALCDKLRRDERLGPIPLMFLSAHQTPDVMRRSDAGGAYFLRKPCDATVLVELVASTLAAARQPCPTARTLVPTSRLRLSALRSAGASSNGAAYHLPASELPLSASATPALA